MREAPLARQGFCHFMALVGAEMRVGFGDGRTIARYSFPLTFRVGGSERSSAPMEVRGWWEKPLAAPAAAAVPCRDATASGACVERFIQSVECETVVEPATGEPVRRCLKLYKRYLKCAGR